jgi:hypothetical protein
MIAPGNNHRTGFRISYWHYNGSNPLAGQICGHELVAVSEMQCDAIALTHPQRLKPARYQTGLGSNLSVGVFPATKDYCGALLEFWTFKSLQKHRNTSQAKLAWPVTPVDE